jgi:hypothetical protein
MVVTAGMVVWGSPPLVVVGGDESQAALGEDVETQVAAGFGPLVLLPGQHGADQADEGVGVGKLPTTSVRRRISRFEPLVRLAVGS